MIWALVKREQALRWLPMSCVFALLTAWAMAPMLAIPQESVAEASARTQVSAGSAHAIALLIAVLSVASFKLRFLPIRIRVREFERTLPIAVRDAVLARMLTTFVSLIVPLLVALGFFAARSNFNPWLATLYGALTVSCSVAVMFAYRPARPALGVLETIGIVVAGLGVAYASTAAAREVFAIAAPLALLGAMALIVAGTRRGTLADDPRPTESSASASSLDVGARVFGPLRWTLMRSTVLRPQTLALYSFALIAPATLVRGNRFLLLVIAVQVAAFSLQLALQSLRGLGGLPVARERLLRYAALPSLLVLVASAVATDLNPRPFLPREPFDHVVAIEQASDDTLTDRDAHRAHVRVPPAFWRIGRRSDAVITAPWGETAEMHAHPLWSGADLVAFNPYDMDLSSGARFLEWQLARALRAVHGDSPDPNATAKAWVGAAFSEDDVGPWAWRREQPARIALPKLTDSDATTYGYARDPWRDLPRRAGFAALQATLVWLVLAAFVLRPNVPDVRGRTWYRILSSPGFGITLLIGFALAVILYEAADRALIEVLEASAGQWIDERIGGSPWAWTVLVATVAAGGYAFLRWRIGRIEVPPPMISGWTKKPVAIF